jgi:hydrogenase maturation factor
VQPAVAAACELPTRSTYRRASCRAGAARAAEAEWRCAHPLGAGAARIGSVVAERQVVRAAIGGTRLIDLPASELLPRIC